MSKLLPLRRVAAGVSLGLVALTGVAGLSGCDRRQPEVPTPAPGGQTTPAPAPAPVPDTTPTNPMPPASAASR